MVLATKSNNEKEHFNKLALNLVLIVNTFFSTRSSQIFFWFSYLGSHHHGGAPPDAQDGNVRLGGDEVQDLSDGLLVRVVPKHHALQRVPRHLCADAVDNAFGVGLIHGDHLDFGGVRDVEEVLFLKSDP